jgi:DNA polymerase IV
MAEAGRSGGLLCRDCASAWRLPAHSAWRLPAQGTGRETARCPRCGSRRLLRHGELATLSIAHIDCDAFYATVEKRDNPALAPLPVIVGGGRRGVVSACCYVARLYGVRSAMPMYKALDLCPDAVVLPPDMRKYAEVGRAVRAMMREVTPLVEPLSIDEAYLDLTGDGRSRAESPARTLIRLARRLETELGITASVGLSYNKFLAKVASDLDKPRGFKVIGRKEAPAFLEPQPVGLIWGVGKALEAKLHGEGIVTIADLRKREEHWLVGRFGAMGRRLYRFARGEDDRRVEPPDTAKSISAETTFETDLSDAEDLKQRLRPLAERVARRAGMARLAGSSVVLKLKTADFGQLTRSRRLDRPTADAGEIWQAACALLEKEADGTRFRLIGVGIADLHGAAEVQPDLLTPGGGPASGEEGAG